MESEMKHLEVEQQSVWHQVTPFTKYSAMLLIILPFLGVWVGYTRAPESHSEIKADTQEIVLKEATEPLIEIGETVIFGHPRKEHPEGITSYEQPYIVTLRDLVALGYVDMNDFENVDFTFSTSDPYFFDRAVVKRIDHEHTLYSPITDFMSHTPIRLVGEYLVHEPTKSITKIEHHQPTLTSSYKSLHRLRPSEDPSEWVSIQKPDVEWGNAWWTERMLYYHIDDEDYKSVWLHDYVNDVHIELYQEKDPSITLAYNCVWACDGLYEVLPDGNMVVSRFVTDSGHPTQNQYVDTILLEVPDEYKK